MKITSLTANVFRSDGGAMFGLVPKPLWSRLCQADADNAIPQRANVLLVTCDDGRHLLLDSGCGDPAGFSERERSLHGLEQDWLLPRQLAAHGLGFDDIDAVLLTHAHWDHAGGLCLPTGQPTFPNAEIFLRAQELDCALGGDPLLYKSYPASVQQTLQRLRGRIRPLPDVFADVLPGLRMIPAPGHSAGQAAYCFQQPDLDGHGPVPAALYAGDNCPTRHHLRMVFQTAYDTEPLRTRAWKREWFPRCAAENTWLLFTHDADVQGIRIAADPKREYIEIESWPCPAL